MEQLEARVAELEATLNPRPWDLPPYVTVDMDPAPPLGSEQPLYGPHMEVREEDWKRKGYL